MREPSGRKSSPLGEIRPREWPAEFIEELLELLWVLGHTVNMSPDLASLLDAVLRKRLLKKSKAPIRQLFSVAHSVISFNMVILAMEVDHLAKSSQDLPFPLDFIIRAGFCGFPALHPG